MAAAAHTILLKKTPFQQRGQAIFIAMFVLMISAVMLIILYNTSLATSKKMKVVNAADAAAYSAAIWNARQLNYMAYTNRAMIANHIVVGHFISYVSWIRYVEDSVANIQKLTFWIPVIGQAVAAARKGAKVAKKITEFYAKLFVPTIDLLNSFYSSTQSMSKSYGFVAIPNIMTKTAQEYDPDMSVNLPSALDGSWAQKRGQDASNLNLLSYAAFTSRYTPSNDNGRISDLVRASFGSSKGWIEGNRGWDFEIPFVVKIEKEGSTTMQNDLRDWDAHDELSYRTWNIPKWKWGSPSTIGEGEATAKEFWRPYQGVRSYADLRFQNLAKQRLALTAYVSLPVTNVKFKDAMDMTHPVENISAVSRAEVYHQRPPQIFGFTGGQSLYEHSNVYNPFWYARLITPDPQNP